MRILAIETTGPFASVAVIDENGNVSELCSDQRMNHLKGLSAMIAEALSARRMSVGDVDCVAVSEGPGSFTGIRIGVSTARALAQVMGVETIGVPTLAAFAYNMPSYEGVVCPVFDARREQLYCGAFRLLGEGGYRTLLEGAARTAAELYFALEGVLQSAREGQAREIRFFGDGIDVFGDMTKKLRALRPGGFEVSIAPLEWRFQRASSIALLARFMLQNSLSQRAGNTGAKASYAGLLPVYMRQAEAERKLTAARECNGK
jgi:tRNA threonylcarbamoyladenosine biosynthesis protein TsaB